MRTLPCAQSGRRPPIRDVGPGSVNRILQNGGENIKEMEENDGKVGEDIGMGERVGET